MVIGNFTPPMSNPNSSEKNYACFSLRFIDHPNPTIIQCKSHSVGYLKNWNIISPSVSTVDSEIRYPGFDANEDGLREDTNATLELPLKSQNSRVGLPQLRLDESLRSQKSRSKSISNWSEVEQSNTSRKPRTVSLSKGSKDL